MATGRFAMPSRSRLEYIPTACLLIAFVACLSPALSSAQQTGSASKPRANPRPPAGAEPDARVAPLLAEVEAALRSGVPEVALVKLEALPKSARASAAARLLEIEALARSSNPARAVEIPTSGLETCAAAPFWQGRALASLNRWPEALLKFQLAADLGFGAEARLGVADSLRAIGATESAAGILDSLLPELSAAPDNPLLPEALLRRIEIDLALADSQNAAKRIDLLSGLPGVPTGAIALQKGRLRLLEGDATAAAGEFRAVLDSTGGSQTRLLAPATLGLAVALEKLGEREKAGDILAAFIEKNPAHPDLPRLFSAYERFLPSDPGPIDPGLIAWSRGPNVPRKIWAVYYLARAEGRAGKRDRAISRLEDTIRDFPDAPSLPATLVTLAQLHLDDGDLLAALKAAAAARALGGTEGDLSWLSFIEGRALFRLGRFTEASEAFGQAAALKPLEEVALYNAAICAMRTGDYQQFLDRYAAFSSRFPESPARRDLLVERGLFQARNRDPEAAQTLTLFLKDFPGHPRTGEVRLALAEIRFLEGPEQAATALDLLSAARESGLSAALESRADLLELWIAEALPGVSADEAIRLGRNLLEKRGQRPMTPLIRLKLGSIYYQIEDYANARDQFSLAARDAADPALSDRAAFMAAMAAMRLMDPNALADAFALFQEIAEAGGPLARDANRFRAEIKTMLGEHAEAAAIYSAMLDENPPPRERAEISLLKANALVNLGGDSDPAQVLKALPLYDAAAEAAASYPALRSEALFMKGRALEGLGQRDKALATYFDVLRTPMGGALDPEFFWFYKAGFEAARLLEERGSYESAVEVYAQLADADGPSAKDAARRMEQLRLRHFLWGD